MSKEEELLKQIEELYNRLKKVSDSHFENRGGILVMILPNRDNFIATFDKLFDAAVLLKALGVDYFDLHLLCTLKSKEVQSLRNIKYSDSPKKEKRNENSAEKIMSNIIYRLTNTDLSEILNKIADLEIKDDISDSEQ